MNLKTFKKWFLRVVMLLVFLNVIAFVLFNREINKFWGAHTTVVDPAQFATPQQTIAITNVQVLSADGNSMMPEQTVLIDQGKIDSMGTDISIPQDAVVLDGQGKYLIPGLIDSHVHLWQSANDLLLYVANGITHIRELNGSDEHVQWKQEIKAGRMGPHLFVASSRMNSNGVFKGWFDAWTAKITSINGLNDAQSVVQSFSDAGFDAIKIYTFLNKDNFSEVVAAAKEVGIPVLGHIPLVLDLQEFWQSGVKELAHIEELVKALDREYGGYDSPDADAFLQFVRQRSEAVAEQLVKHEIYVVSTLWLMESFSQQKLDIDGSLEDVALAYVNPGIAESTHPSIRVMGWLPDVNIYRIPEGLSLEKQKDYQIYWDTYAEANRILLRAMVKKGVQVMAGTDANVPITVPGFSMHDELKSLHDAGMTPAQVLRSATAVPARKMGIKSGQIKAGFRADVILLNGNPLENIQNTRKIDSVIVDGRLLRRPQLDAMLNAVKQANDASRKKDISRYEVHAHH